MADAKIEITAEAGQAKATLEELRTIAASVFEGVKLDANKAKEATESLAQGWSKAGVSAGEAQQAAAKLRPQVDELANSTKGAAAELKDFAKAIGLIGSATVYAQRYLNDLKEAITPLVDQLRNAAYEAGGTREGVERLEEGFNSFISPAEGAADLLRNIVNLYRDLREAITDVTVEQQRAEKAVTQLTAAQRETEQSLSDQANALALMIEKERERGEVTGQTEKAVEKLVKAYESSGVEIPQILAETMQSLGLLTKAQEDAAKAAEKAAEEAEKAAEKQAQAAAKAQEALDKKAASLAAETAELEKQFSAEEQLLPKLKEFAEGKKAGTAAVDDSVRALKEELSILEQAAKAAEDAAKSAGARASQAAGRIAELEGKPVLTIDEQNELNDLKAAQVDIDNEAADAADNAAQAAFEYGDAQAALGESTDKASESLDYASGVMAELEAATTSYQAALANVGDEAQSATAYVEAVGKDGTKFWTNFTDTVVGGNEALGDTGDALGDIAGALPDTADGLYQVGDALKQIDAPGGDGEDKGLSKVATDAKTLAKELLPEILRLCKEIKEEAGSITLGGGGAGI